MSIFSDCHNDSLNKLYENTLDELEKIREDGVYKNGTEYTKGLIDGAITQTIKFKEKIIW